MADEKTPITSKNKSMTDLNQNLSKLPKQKKVTELLKKQKFEPSLHAFRGFAILNVVAVHVFGFFIYYAQVNKPGLDVKWLDRVNEVLFHDATIYFTLISGILFSLVLKQRGWKSFYRSKLLNVIVPYFLMTLLFTWTHYSFGGYKLFNEGFASYLQNVGKNLLTGDAIFTFWYIPVLMVLYLITPILVALTKNKITSGLLIALAISPLFFSRVWPEISWTTFMYFTGIYTVGIHVGNRFNLIMETSRKYIFVISALFTISTVVLWYLYKYEIQKWGILSFQETAFYIQKLSFSCLILLLFKRFAGKLPKWLDALGDYAFPIYFLHAYLIFVLYDWLAERQVALSSTPLLILFCIIALCFTLTVCFVIAKLFNIVFGRWSRHIIGG